MVGIVSCWSLLYRPNISSKLCIMRLDVQSGCPIRLLLQDEHGQAQNIAEIPELNDVSVNRTQSLDMRASRASSKGINREPGLLSRLFGSCCRSSSNVVDGGNKEWQTSSRRASRKSSSTTLAGSHYTRSFHDKSFVRALELIALHRCLVLLVR